MTWLNTDTGMAYDHLDYAPPGACVYQHNEKEK